MSEEERKLLITVAKIVRQRLMAERKHVLRDPGLADNDLLWLNIALHPFEKEPTT